MVYRLSLRDFQNWDETRDFSLHTLLTRARRAAVANKSVVELNRANFDRWRRGAFTPWLVKETTTPAQSAQP